MNENIFNQITNDNTAYWLGFLAADGSVSYLKNKYQLMIGLSSKDKNHLEKFKNFLNAPNIITDRNTLCNNNKRYPSSYITIFSKQIFDDLSQYGIIPNKIYQNIDFLSYIPEPYKLPFIIGLFDGDGYFTCTDKSQSFGFCGNQAVIRTIYNYLENYFQWNSNITVNNYAKSISTYYFTHTAQQRVLDFCNLYLSYIDKCDLLERKKQKAQQLISILEIKIQRNNNKINRTNKIKICYSLEKIKQICPICKKEFLTSKFKNQKYCSQECVHKSQYKCEHPDKDILYNQLIEYKGNFTQVAKIYGITDNAIRKWCKKYNIPFHSKDYK